MIGESGQVVVLDMGEPVRIIDLAHDLIALSGVGAEDVRIEISGLRPGEKLYEEPLGDDETTIPTSIPKLRVATARRASPGFVDEFAGWCAERETRSDDDVRAAIGRWVPEYRRVAST